MLVTVMIETLEGVAMADEIAATHGVDVVILGNNDLSSFSGWKQNDPRYQDAIIKVHDAALKYGKYYGNAGAQYLNGYTVSADTRMVQNGPACDGWTPPARRRRAAGRRAGHRSAGRRCDEGARRDDSAAGGTGERGAMLAVDDDCAGDGEIARYWLSAIGHQLFSTDR